MDNTQNLPDHLTNALNKDYSKVMKAVEQKSKFKNGTLKRIEDSSVDLRDDLKQMIDRIGHSEYDAMDNISNSKNGHSHKNKYCYASLFKPRQELNITIWKPMV